MEITHLTLPEIVHCRREAGHWVDNRMPQISAWNCCPSPTGKLLQPRSVLRRTHAQIPVGNASPVANVEPFLHGAAKRTQSGPISPALAPLFLPNAVNFSAEQLQRHSSTRRRLAICSDVVGYFWGGRIRRWKLRPGEHLLLMFKVKKKNFYCWGLWRARHNPSQALADCDGPWQIVMDCDGPVTIIDTILIVTKFSNKPSQFLLKHRASASPLQYSPVRHNFRHKLWRTPIPSQIFVTIKLFICSESRTRVEGMDQVFW